MNIDFDTQMNRRTKYSTRSALTMSKMRKALCRIPHRIQMKKMLKYL